MLVRNVKDFEVLRFSEKRERCLFRFNCYFVFWKYQAVTVFLQKHSEYFLKGGLGGGSCPRDAGKLRGGRQAPPDRRGLS